MIKRQQNVHRQKSCPSIGNALTGSKSKGSDSASRGSFTSCAMGDEDSVSEISVSSQQSFNGSFSFSDAPKRKPVKNGFATLLPTSTFNGYHAGARDSRPLPRWVLPLMYGLTMLSWFRAILYRSGGFEILAAMDVEIESLESQILQTSKLLKDARKGRDSIAKQQKQLKKTKKLFQHEIRMMEEMFEIEHSVEGEDIQIPQETLDKFKKRKSMGVAATWVEQRQEALLHKVYNLQAYIREESKKSVMQKYGEGPHRVEFKVLSREGKKRGVFIVELAPLDLVPHAIETFLDMVASKVWDNTVFYHHFTQNHVLAAAPVAYGTFNSKQHQMEALGFAGVGFPEYSKLFPHERYTLGFSGKGPNFYINTKNNSDHHGPGGQGHHDLPTDADPCFGRVVSGLEVLNEDMMSGRHKGTNPKGWEDFDVSRIVSVRIME